MTAAVSHALPRFAITDLGEITPLDINNRGQIVGSSYSPQRAILYENGTLYDLGVPAGEWSFASSINASGQIVGTYLDDKTVRGFLYSEGQVTTLPSLPGFQMQPTAINDHGQIVGAATDNGNTAHAFLYSNGILTDLDPVVGPSRSVAHDINNAGEVVGIGAGGRRGFLYSGDTAIHFDLEPSGFATEADAINDLGQVTLTSTRTDAFIYDHGQMINIGHLAFNSHPTDINEAGQVVGWANFGRGRTAPFFYDDGQMVFLDTLLLPDSGWTLTSYEFPIDVSLAINDSGQIVGQALKRGVGIRGFLLTPVIPDPATLPFALATTAALARRRHPRAAPRPS